MSLSLGYFHHLKRMSQNKFIVSCGICGNYNELTKEEAKKAKSAKQIIGCLGDKALTPELCCGGLVKIGCYKKSHRCKNCTDKLEVVVAADNDARHDDFAKTVEEVTFTFIDANVDIVTKNNEKIDEELATQFITNDVITPTVCDELQVEISETTEGDCTTSAPQEYHTNDDAKSGKESEKEKVSMNIVSEDTEDMGESLVTEPEDGVNIANEVCIDPIVNVEDVQDIFRSCLDDKKQKMASTVFDDLEKSEVDSLRWEIYDGVAPGPLRNNIFSRKDLMNQELAIQRCKVIEYNGNIRVSWSCFDGTTTFEYLSEEDFRRLQEIGLIILFGLRKSSITSTKNQDFPGTKDESPEYKTNESKGQLKEEETLNSTADDVSLTLPNDPKIKDTDDNKLMSSLRSITVATFDSALMDKRPKRILKGSTDYILVTYKHNSLKFLIKTYINNFKVFIQIKEI